jgi:hypothetical protein
VYQLRRDNDDNDGRIYREAREGGLVAVDAFIGEVGRYGETEDT